MTIKNGDLPAYPSIDETRSVICDDGAYASALSINYGLTKREMFAMAAMQGLLANESDRLPKYIASDALLAELERTK